MMNLDVTRFEHSADPAMTGMRGVRLNAATRFQSRNGVFSETFPTVFVSDSGDVEIGDELRIPQEDAAAWFRAVAEYLEPEASICPNVYPFDGACRRRCTTQCAAVFDKQGAAAPTSDNAPRDLMAALRASVQKARSERLAREHHTEGGDL